MKYRLLIILLSLFVTNVSAQKLDSIPYPYGYLYYQVYGNTGETIVLLSGGPGNNAAQLAPVASKLGENNKVVLLEQRGTGRSIPSKFDKSTINIDSAMNDINLVLDALKTDKIVLLGHSYGASLASIYGSQFPERVKAMILVAPGLLDYDAAFVALCNISSKFSKQENRRWEALYSKSYSNDLSDAEKKEYKYLNRQAYVYNKSKIDDLLPLLEGNINTKTNAILSADIIESNFSLEKLLENINFPMHIICGRQDVFSFITYDYKIEKPSIKIHWIDESGHFPMFEQPKEFYSILDKLLN